MIVDHTFPSEHAFLEEVYAKKLSQRGHHIVWLFRVAEKRLKCTTAEWHGTKVYLVPNDVYFGPVLKIYLTVALLTKVFRIAVSEHSNVIQVRNWALAGWFALAVSRILGIRFVFQRSFPMEDAALLELGQRESKSRRRKKVLIKQWMLRSVMRRADKLFPISAEMQEEMEREGFPKERMVPVGLGFSPDNVPETDELRRVSEKLAIGKAKMVLYVGTLSPLRQPEVMLRAHKIVLESLPGTKLVIVGGAPDEVLKLAEVGKGLGIEPDLILTGKVHRGAVPAYISLADVCLSPIPEIPLYKVSSPTKLYEYLGMGKVVVGSKVPEQVRVITESSGGICVRFDENEFAAAIVSLLSDDSDRKSRGFTAREYSMKHTTYDLTSSMLEKTYRDLLRA